MAKVVRCVRCHRKLRGKRSRELGIGGSCRRFWTGYTIRKAAEIAGQLDLFGAEGSNA